MADPIEAPGTPIVLNNAYFELGGVNLRCFVNHMELSPENKLVTATTMCAETDYPGATKWHLKMTFYQSFPSVYGALSAALANYNANGSPVPFKMRSYNRAAASDNVEFDGLAIPQPFPLLVGDAGALSEVQIDWSLQAPPTSATGAITATGANAGIPGFFTPAGANVPANLAALTGLTASPATAWTTGQYVITADRLGSHWSGSAWVAGIA
jgi:hypothetical protein